MRRAALPPFYERWLIDARTFVERRVYGEGVDRAVTRPYSGWVQDDLAVAIERT